MDTRDTDFTNLQPGDEVTVVWTVQDDGRLSSRADGSMLCDLRHILGLGHGREYERNAFVSKRQPRPLKPGDDFAYSIGFDRSPGLVRSIIHIDDQGVLYDYMYQGSTTRRYDSLPHSSRGVPVHVKP